MEKKYLELITRGTKRGAFEDVKVFEDRGKDGLYVECADGTFTLPVYGKGWAFEQVGMYFDEYKLVCRRTLRAHTNELKDVLQVKLN